MIGTVRQLIAAFPLSELVIVEGAGHFPFIEKPDAFLQAVRDFLESVSGRRR